VTAVGVESTGAYGAEPARVLAEAGLQVVEVDRPDRNTRGLEGKSDPVDACAAAEAVASGRASGTPKTRGGIVGAVRALRVPRRSAIKSRTQALPRTPCRPRGLPRPHAPANHSKRPH
jgi:transposase